MDFRDLIEEALLALTSNKARSVLTILGIVIGIGSVIAMISIGQGAQGQIEDRIQSLGSNLVRVSPGSQSGFSGVRSARGSARTLTIGDAVAIKEQVNYVQNVAPEISNRYQIIYKSKNSNTQVVGTNEAYPSVRNLEMTAGIFISEPNVSTNGKVAVLGPATRDDLFGEGSVPIGENIKINGISFKIIGITKSKGSSGFNNQDDVIYIPISTASRFLSGEDLVNTINIQATEEKFMSQVQNGITSLLLSRHNIRNPTLADFSVLNQNDIVETATEVTGTFTILLASIAAISLLVGGIGIMNMMLTSVTERTREIGLRKAIGAKKNYVTMQFLSEATILTVVGGLFGILLGILVSWGVTKFAGIAAHISKPSILLAFGVSAGIGIIFGYYPAKRAAKLNPIDALRYE